MQRTLLWKNAKPLLPGSPCHCHCYGIAPHSVAAAAIAAVLLPSARHAGVARSNSNSALAADGPASLLPRLNLSVNSLLFGDNHFQGVGHPLELLLVCIVEFIHALDEGAVHHIIAVRIPCCCLMYHGDDFTQ